MEWIRVEDALPEPWTSAIVRRTRAGQHLGTRIHDDIQVGYLYRKLNGDMEFRTDLNADMKLQVSHWMPLPPPPEAE